MKQSFVLSLCLGFVSSVSFAGVLNMTPGEKSIETIKLASSAQISTGKTTANLSPLGAGLRNKKVVFVNVKVYVGQFFAQDASSFQKGSALDSIDQQKVVAMNLTFLRDVEAKQVQASFKDSFDANKIDQKDPSIAQFMDAVNKGGDADKNKNLSVVGIKNDDKTETVIYESPTGQVTSVNGPEGLRRKIFSLWFGEAADGGVTEFRKAVLQ